MNYSRKLTFLVASCIGSSALANIPSATLDAHAKVPTNYASATQSQHQPAHRQAGYREYPEIQELFAQYEVDYPNIVEFMELPWMLSQEGRPIIALKITTRTQTAQNDGTGFVDNSDEAGPADKAAPTEKPGIVITGGTHGDEWIGTEVALGIAEQLIQGFGVDPRVSAMVEGSVVYVIPVTSPDSFHISRDVHGVDPNRVFPYPGNDKEPSIASARSMLKFFDTFRPQGSIDFHGVGGVIVHPWGYTCNPVEDPADFARFKAAGSAMAMHNGYVWGDLCNTLYQAAGGSQDGYYYLYDTLAFSIETGASSKKPPESEIPTVLDQCTSSAWALIEYLITNPDDDGDTTTTGDSTAESETGNTGETGTNDTQSTGASTGDTGATSDTTDGTGTTGTTGTTGNTDANGSGDESPMESSSNGSCRSAPTSPGSSLVLIVMAIFVYPLLKAPKKARNQPRSRPSKHIRRAVTHSMATLAILLTLGSCIADTEDQPSTSTSTEDFTNSNSGTATSTGTGTPTDTGASSDTDASTSTSTSTGGPEIDPLPPVDCNNLPPLPLTYKKLDFVPGCEDFTFDREGNLVGITKARNYVKVPFGGPEKLLLPNLGGGDQFAFTRGSRYLPNGDLIVADPASASLLRVANDGSNYERVLSNIPEPNGIAVDFSGMVYLSLLSGEIWRVNPELQSYEVLHHDPDPNPDPNTRFDGITLGLDYNSLYFNTEDRLEIFRLPLSATGPAPAIPERIATIVSDQGTSIPPLLDGMTVDECGNLYIAEIHGIVHRLSVTGELEVVADMSEHYPALTTALNFGSGIGGWNAHTLYVMIIQGGMYTIDLGVGRKPEPYLDIATPAETPPSEFPLRELAQ